MKNKILPTIPMIIFVIVLVINVVTFYYTQCDTDYYSSKDYLGRSQSISKQSFVNRKDIINSLPGDYDEAIASIDESIRTELEMEDDEYQRWKNSYKSKSDQYVDLIGDYEGVRELYEWNNSIQRMRSDIRDNSQVLVGLPIFNSDDIAQGISITAKDFYGLENMNFKPAMDNGINVWMNYRISDYFMVILVVASAIFCSLYNRGLIEKNVRNRNNVLGIGAVVLGICVVALYVSNALLVYQFIDKFDLNMWVQSYMSFKYCPQLIHLWQFMLAAISMKVVAALILYLLIVAILHCVRKMRVFMIVGVSVFLVAEGILAFGKQTVNALQEINIFSALTFERFFITYSNINIGGTAVPRLTCFLIFIAILSAGLIIMETYTVRKCSLRIYEKIQYSYYEDINQKYTETRRLWHDFHNHLLAIQELMRVGRFDDANAYMKEIEDDIDNTHILTKSGSEALDVLIYQKSETARLNNIKFEVSINTRLKSEGFKDTAICCVVGNLLDNSIEALNKIDKEKESLDGASKWISLEISRIGEMLYISVANPYYGRLDKDSKGFRTTKADKSRHGIGLGSVQHICEKYNGSLNVTDEDGVFRVQALMMSK